MVPNLSNDLDSSELHWSLYRYLYAPTVHLPLTNPTTMGMMGMMGIIRQRNLCIRVLLEAYAASIFDKIRSFPGQLGQGSRITICTHAKKKLLACSDVAWVDGFSHPRCTCKSQYNAARCSPGYVLLKFWIGTNLQLSFSLGVARLRMGFMVDVAYLLPALVRRV